MTPTPAAPQLELRCSACKAPKAAYLFSPSMAKKPNGRICISCTREKRKAKRATRPKGNGFRATAVYFAGKRTNQASAIV